MAIEAFAPKDSSIIGKPIWEARPIRTMSFACGHCGNLISNGLGFQATVSYQQLIGSRMEKSAIVGAYIQICHVCGHPTYFDPRGDQQPLGVVGRRFKHVPDDLISTYYQAVRCLKARCLEASVMVARRLLMVLAWRLKADDGKTFQYYVEYLVSVGAISAPMKVWVDKIRTVGNAATHEIPSVVEDDAKAVLKFIELVFENVFEAAGEAGLASPFELRV